MFIMKFLSPHTSYIHDNLSFLENMPESLSYPTLQITTLMQLSFSLLHHKLLHFMSSYLKLSWNCNFVTNENLATCHKKRDILLTFQKNPEKCQGKKTYFQACFFLFFLNLLLLSQKTSKNAVKMKNAKTFFSDMPHIRGLSNPDCCVF